VLSDLSCAQDSNLCNTEACVPLTGACASGPTTSCAQDSNLCNTEACVPLTGACASGPTTSCAQDSNLCTTEDCIPATGACGTVSTVSCASAGLPDVCCDPGDGQCKNDPNLDPSCGIVEICRTPGFWKEHAGTEKDRSQNITQAVIDALGGCIEICGEVIKNTAVNNADSAVEAMAVSPQGNQRLQLVRQLTAAALNCIMSNPGSTDCSGVSIFEVFKACNKACADGNTTAIVDTTEIDCIGAIDCFNNGGKPDPLIGCQTGECANQDPCNDETPCTDLTACVPLANNCHSQPLCNEDGLCFEPPGPAGSQSASKAAQKNNCTVIPPGESNCSTGTKSNLAESCPD